jgi:hypothetical protein
VGRAKTPSGYDLQLEIRLGRFVGHVHTPTARIELPAVIDAPQAALFIAPKEQRGAAMRAMTAYQADLPSGVAEGDELLAEQQYAHGIAVGPR